MKNKGKNKTVTSSKDLINNIVSSDDIKKAATSLGADTKLIYNVLGNSNKKDEERVLKALKKVIKKRLEKEQKILTEITV